jgi:ubiquinone/menaquinone biosynthesis C-methylase UbiE
MQSSVRKRKPSKTDVSRPGRAGDYTFKKRFYRDGAVAQDYDFHRFGSRRRARRNARKWRAIVAALERTQGTETILDLPCGTGRFTGDLAGRGYRVIGSDISHQMMQVARDKTKAADGVVGYLQADAERLPFRTGGVDCVICIRFFLHVDSAARVRILREMQRVSRRWLIIDYRHRYSSRYLLWRLRKVLGLTKTELSRVSRVQLEQEFREAGWTIREVIPVVRFFSDKWIVVGQPAPGIS